MSIFYQEEPSHPSRKCKCLILALKDAFAKCHSFRGKVTHSSLELDEPISIFDDEEEEIFVSAIISKYMESKSKRKSNIGIDSFNWALSPAAVKKYGNCVENVDEFWSANSRLSRCSSDTSFDAFVSAKTCLSRCSSLNGIDHFQDFGGNRRSSVILELMNCEGWPFGLCRKALLLPPLPKSPADSWSWRKSGGMIRIH
ncbi:hypothetical protein PHJA_001598400 [Phtheirospermum japonicum]|uniref:Uncharacterized protein n=1 Tax=Phtheirospermum japonicum TaxID=374723 RepID=A0A830C4H6_9LAMI|nr:hypothetical protein PHJA_001598400 [Phtheirospermum japonicum]